MPQHGLSPNNIDEYPFPGVVDGNYFQTPHFHVDENSTSGYPARAEPTWSNSARSQNLGADISSRVGHQEVASRGSQNFPSAHRGRGHDGPNSINMDDVRSYQSAQAADTPRPKNPSVLHVPEMTGYHPPQGNFDRVPLSTQTSDGTSSYEEILSDDGVKLLRCSCGKKIKRRGDMLRHLESLKHSQVRQHGCSWCERRYTRKDGLDRHKKICKNRPECGMSDPRLIAKAKKERKK